MGGAWDLLVECVTSDGLAEGPNETSSAGLDRVSLHAMLHGSTTTGFWLLNDAVLVV